jgi:replicative DNA helicase
VREHSIKRSLIQVATEIVDLGFEHPGSAAELLDSAESRIFEIGQSKSRATFTSFESEVHLAVDYLEALHERAGDLTGVPTGFVDLDHDTGGLQPGELIVIAARPSMGKTAFALNCALHAAIHHQKKVAIFSLEMTKRSLVLRLLSSEGEVNLNQFRKGYSNLGALKKLSKAAGDIAGAKIWIDDSGTLTILEIKAKARRLAAEHGLDLVVLDYLQLAHGNLKHPNKNLEIAEISHGLKALAKEINIPVVALSQLNRGPEQRDPDQRRPNMGDLRESGAIEQDADLIGFIYRDELQRTRGSQNSSLQSNVMGRQER